LVFVIPRDVNIIFIPRVRRAGRGVHVVVGWGSVVRLRRRHSGANCARGYTVLLADEREIFMRWEVFFGSGGLDQWRAIPRVDILQLNLGETPPLQNLPTAVEIPPIRNPG
jgi:hypothetical protein